MRFSKDFQMPLVLNWFIAWNLKGISVANLQSYTLSLGILGHLIFECSLCFDWRAFTEYVYCEYLRSFCDSHLERMSGWIFQ